ncbi:hypothetical protein BD410DRAFT_790297, partial [Rickenella mellea]
MDPATFSAADSRMPPPPPSPSPTVNRIRERERGFPSRVDNNISPPDSPRTPHSSFLPPPLFPSPEPGKAHPPPVDPGVFRSVTSIRKLIDEASELSVRAASGLSAAALGSIRSPNTGGMNSPWATAQAFGLNPLGDQGGGGRNVTMSANRVHRLRVLAVQKLAAAYKADEIASSVMVMQGGSVFDDIAEKVLKVDPTNVDARYVHFFHEKIPSRQLAESTTTSILDELIAANPQRLEFFRTRGIVHCFRDEYTLAIKDFTHALKEARALRRARTSHNGGANGATETRAKGKRKKAKSNGQAPPSGTSAVVEGPDGEQLLLHPSVLPDAPDPIEPQLLFHRGAAYLAHALFAVEEAILKLEGIQKAPVGDGAELRLCYIENGKYGGTEIGNPDGPLGRNDGEKARAYRRVLADEGMKEQVYALLKKSIRDHEKFLSHFDTLESGEGDANVPIAQRVERAFLLSESLRPGSRADSFSTASSYHTSNPYSSASTPYQQQTPPSLSHLPPPIPFTTYHPLLVEAHFSILLSHLLLGDFSTLLPAFARAATLVAGLEGYPVFLPPRSMAQAEFVETLERLAGGWRAGAGAGVAEGLGAGLGLGFGVGKGKEVIAIEDSRTQSGTTLNCKTEDSSASASGSTSHTSAPSQSPSTNNDANANTCAPSPSPRPTLPSLSNKSTATNPTSSLPSMRTLLAPVIRRQTERHAAANSTALSTTYKTNSPGADDRDNGYNNSGNGNIGGNGGNGRGGGRAINIPLHGPRVEILLAWIGAVHLPDLECEIEGDMGESV